MIRGTTPTFTLTISARTGSAVDLSTASNVYVSIVQGMTNIILTGDELSIENNVVSCYLPQEKSIRLADNTTAKVQVNWTYIDALDGVTVRRAATKFKEIPIEEQLLKRVIA